MDVETKGRELIAKIRSDLGELLTAEGFKYERRQYRSGEVAVDVDFALVFGRRDYDVIKLAVKPPYNIGARKVTYQVKVREATPESAKIQIDKAAAKAREFKAAGERQAIAKERAVQSKQAQLLAVGEAMARYLPEFRNSGDGSIYFGSHGIDIVPVPYDETRVKLRLNNSLTYEEARTIVDFINSLRTSAVSGDSTDTQPQSGVSS